MSTNGWPTPAQIQDDLRGLFRGSLHFDLPTCSLFASDASALRLLPYGVARPRDTADVAELMSYAHGQQLPLAARGAGTGQAGESLCRGIVVDMYLHFQDILEVGEDYVRVQPGITWGKLQRELATYGKRLAPELARADVRTVGGAVAVGVLGGNAHLVGSLRDQVLALEVVWNTGEVGQILRPLRNTVNAGERGARHIGLRAQTAALIAEHRDTIQIHRSHTAFDRTPYQLHDVLTADGLDLTKVIIGSEGTLAFITEVTLKTVPLPGARLHAVLGFATLEQAVSAGTSLRMGDGVTACDVLDQRFLALLRTTQQGRVFPQTLGAILLLSVEGDDSSSLQSEVMQALDELRRGHSYALLEEPTLEDDLSQLEPSWRDLAYRGLAALGTRAKPSFACADTAVPIDELARFVTLVQQRLSKHRLAAPLEIRCTTGLVSALPIVDLTEADDRERLWAATEEIHEAAIGLGGTICGSVATGLLRAPWLAKHAAPLLPILRELKKIYDPQNLLNPGKIFDPAVDLPAWPLPAPPTDAKGKQVPLVLAPVFHPSVDAVRHELDRCNNCGTCRTKATTPSISRMCPTFRALHTEDATPRAKVNLLRELLTSPETVKTLLTEEARNIAGLCVHCKMCKPECPASVDVPALMLEAKAQHFNANGLERGDWLPARLEGLSLLGGIFATQVNLMLRFRSSRWVLEKLIGLSRKRTLPRFTHRTFLRRALRQGVLGRRRQQPLTMVTGPAGSLPRKVAYFVDLFANFNDPSIGLAVVAVLRHHGIEVYVPYRQKGSGLPALVQGDLETAREIATANVRTFAPLIRDGYHIVVSEPSAAVALTQEYPQLLNTPDAELVAANTTEITAFLWNLHQAGQLRTDFEALSLHLGHHVPCHVKALNSTVAGPRLLEMIPGLIVRRLDRGCSGMAGGFGLSAEHYETSHRAGAEMLDAFRNSDIAFGSTECSACRMQMIDGGRKRTYHPVQYLALAYGLLPELRNRLSRPLGRRITD